MSLILSDEKIKEIWYKHDGSRRALCQAQIAKLASMSPEEVREEVDSLLRYIVSDFRFHGAGENERLSYLGKICALITAQVNEALKKEQEYREVLEVARAAIMDAIWCVDGLDGGTGEAVSNWITDLLGDGETYEFVVEGKSDQTKRFRDKALNRQALKGKESGE